MYLTCLVSFRDLYSIMNYKVSSERKLCLYVINLVLFRRMRKKYLISINQIYDESIQVFDQYRYSWILQSAVVEVILV